MSSDDNEDSSVFEGRVKPPSEDTDTTTNVVDTVEDDTGKDLSTGVETKNIAEIDEEWATYFPFDEPYTDQVDGVNAFSNAICGYDNMVMEGACGTGKTLIGLTAGINAIRNQEQLGERLNTTVPDYSRILAVTPVKQQLKQFIDEMKTINSNLNGESDVKTIVMRGRSDMLPYAYVDYYPFDEYHVSAKIDDLRKLSVELIKFGSDIPLTWPDDMDVPDYSRYDYDWNSASDEAEKQRDVNKFDPKRAEAIMKILQNKVEKGKDPLVVNGVETPYPDGIPHTQDLVSTTELVQQNKGQLPSALQGRFDPFFVGFYAFERMPFWFGHANNSVMDAEALFENAASRGICPHEAMADMMEHADVLIGNYYHLFDPDTRLLTDMKTGVLDEETICIVDEAHNIEEKVRDILSDSQGIQSFRTAVNDIRTAKAIVNGDISQLPRSEQSSLNNTEMSNATEKARKVMADPMYASITTDDFENAVELLNLLKQWLTDRSEDHLDDRFDNGWEWVVNNQPDWIETEEIALESNDGESTDELKRLLNEVHDGDAKQICSDGYAIMNAAQTVIEEVTEIDRMAECGDVGEFFYQWTANSHVDFFREIILDDKQKEKPLDDSHVWTKEWTPKYQLYNCIPTNRLREIFSELGSTLLMSATLEPIDVFNKTTGIEQCISPNEIGDKEERIKAISEDKDHSDKFRDVTVRKYPLRFPKSNRLSLIGDLERFTYSNRGQQTVNKNEMEWTREKYGDMICTIAESHGNVMICMPSYSEARWAKKIIDRNASKSALLDESTSAEETDTLLNKFFAGKGKVIVTSTRGTITEGVDYDGDKLNVCAIIGISLLPPSDRNKAIEYAYEEQLDDSVSGRDATNKIPAVRKARQAYGRVLRGNEEKGVRILVDERYGETRYGGVKQYLGEDEKEEFEVVSLDECEERLRLFWQSG